MKFTVQKEQVIKALMTEPLMPGSFTWPAFEGYNSGYGCPVCAVGSIFSSTVSLHHIGPRQADDICCNILHSYSGTDDIRLNTRVQTLLSSAKYLSALSTFFETCAVYHPEKYLDSDELANDVFRKILVDFVQEKFPDSIEIDTKATESI